jgi:uncharacterized membrane protein
MGRKNKQLKQQQSKNILTQLVSYLHHNIQAINNSKIFAGLMKNKLNIVSKFANFKLSKTLESYLKFTFSRQILVFAIAWMGTRDIYIALIITAVFVVVTEYLFHEDSRFFVLSEEFKDYHISMLENERNNDNITDDDIKRAQGILARAKELNLIQDGDSGLKGYSLM